MSKKKPARPLAPHLLHWQWEIHAIVSITHRITGDGMALVGLPILLWWLYVIASGPESYAAFYSFASSFFGQFILIGLTYAFFQHLGSGLRHFVMDIGAGYEINTARRSAIGVYVFAILATAAFWTYMVFIK